MGIVSSSGGKGSNKRPSLVSQETISENFDRIFGKKKPDPVKECETYTAEGCSHVDGMLCEPSTCSEFKLEDDECRILPDEHPLSQLLAAVPSDLYDNSTWVRDMCHQANLVLTELERLKKS